MRAKLAVALLAPLIVMSGCGGSKKNCPDLRRPCRSLDSGPTVRARRRAPAATQCRAADLKVTPSQVDFKGYGNGGGIAVIALRNTGAQPCRLEGTAHVELVKPNGPQAGEHGDSASAD